MLKIGLTGGIGSGKSTAAKRFSELGVSVINLDEISREVVLPGSPALEKIREHFGSEILLQNGALDRQKLREIIFQHESERSWLEDLLHPIIRDRQNELIESAESNYVVIEIPLLTENQLQHTVDRVLVIDIEEQDQIKRAAGRDGANTNEISAILKSQASRKERLSIADDVIENSGSIEELHTKVLELHEQYLEISK
ncbi:UNVERIFIED_CONTAM: hypothetical protein GTU68_022571 [Idotea baltica]|nr:hypothetical protein [Idotea baltica]